MKFSKLICAMILTLLILCTSTACGNSDKKPIEQESPNSNVDSSSSTTEKSTATSSEDEYESHVDEDASWLEQLADEVCYYVDLDYLKTADRTFDKLAEAIKNKDKEKMKSVFSKNAIKEAKTLDKDIEELFGFVKGDVVSYGRTKYSGMMSDSTYDYGKEKTMISPCFTLKTDEAKYYLGIQQCAKDDFDRDNEGIIYFCIINAEDWKEDGFYMHYYENASGIIIE